jgi:hypothetical protein
MSESHPAPSPEHTPTAPSETPSAPPPIPQNSPGFPTPEKIAGQTAQLHTAAAPAAALSPKQQAALNRLFAGEDERFICQTLRIDRKTLYNWKRRHPAFVAEMARRNHELWADVAADLRQGVAHAVATLRDHLARPGEPMTQLRAARALVTLVNSPRLAPTEPTTVPGVLDHLLRAAHTPPAPADPDTPAFTDAQRQALLDQLLAESAAAEAESDAARAARGKPAPPPALPDPTAPA